MGGPVRTLHTRDRSVSSPFFRPFLVLALLAPFLLAADARPLDPDFRPAAPNGWLVQAGEESGYSWIRFSVSEDLEGDDYREAAVTLYRMLPRVPPAEAGEGLVDLKAEAQKVTEREAVDRTVEEVRWRGMSASYEAGPENSRRELYLYTDHAEGALYLLWCRGPAAGWESDEALREAVLRRVSLILTGKDVQETGAPGAG